MRGADCRMQRLHCSRWGVARRDERGHAQRPGPLGEPLGGRVHAVQQQQRLQHQERARQHARQLRAAAAPRLCIGLGQGRVPRPFTAEPVFG